MGRNKTKIIIVLLIILALAVISLFYVLKILPQVDTILPGFTWQTYPLEGYRPIANVPTSGAGGVSP